MFSFRSLVVMLLAGVLFSGGDALFAQPNSAKPIRIVTGRAGGGGDFGARLIAPGLSDALGQSVIVENRSNSVIGAEVTAKAAPDGSTMFLAGNNFWIGPLLQKMPYDVDGDFLPVTLLARAPNILVVHPSLPVSSVKGLIALARARPGEINYASGPTGVPNHIAAEMLKSMARVNIVRVPYTGAAPAISNLLGGETHLMFANAPPALPHMKSGRLRALAVTTAKPTVLAPGLPTIAESGLPGYESVSDDAIFVPARTPATIISRLNQEIVKILNLPDLKET